MLSQSVLFAFTNLAYVVLAWLPTERNPEHEATPLSLRYGNRNYKRWLPIQKIRGVNLGSLFIIEPWMVSSTWQNMGCGGKASEFDCMLALGQEQGDLMFQKHWSTFIQESDFDEMVSYGINTVRIPIGYWMYEKLVYTDSEHFPRGGFNYLRKIVYWAKSKGIHVILVMHGAPGAQATSNAFTGQNANPAGFYVDYQYDRGIQFLEWITEMIYTYHEEFSYVFMLEVVNEPLQWGAAPDTLRSYFYKKAYAAIRAKENSFGISPNLALHVQFMNTLWGAGNPVEYIDQPYWAAFDDHRYLKWVPESQLGVTKDDYIKTSCSDNRQADGEIPTIVGEFSLSVADGVEGSVDWSVDNDLAFYQKWFAAQVKSYEKTNGWVFWSWKTELNDPRWDYKLAVQKGLIPKDLETIDSVHVC